MRKATKGLLYTDNTLQQAKSSETTKKHQLRRKA